MGMPPEERLGMDLRRVVQELMAAKHAAVKVAGITVPQYAALARACLVTPQAMTGVLKNLEEHGLVARTPHEWHRNVLETRLTEEGRAALEVADERAVAIERRISEEFTPAERDLLRALLSRCSDAIGTE